MPAVLRIREIFALPPSGQKSTFICGADIFTDGRMDVARRGFLAMTSPSVKSQNRRPQRFLRVVGRAFGRFFADVRSRAPTVVEVSVRFMYRRTSSPSGIGAVPVISRNLV
jgi:hypothetical protein